MRSWRPFSCGEAGRMKRGKMPSFIHQADNLVRPPAPREPKGEPLSQRIASGRPCSQNALSKQGRTPSVVGATMRSSIRKRLWLSAIVSGSIRHRSRVRNQPLKSTLHSSFGPVTGVQGRRWSSGRRRRFIGEIRPERLRMVPIVDAAGQSISGACRSSSARSLRGPRWGKRRRAAITFSAIASSVVCLHCSGACEWSLNHSGSPLRLRLRHS